MASAFERVFDTAEGFLGRMLEGHPESIRKGTPIEQAMGLALWAESRIKPNGFSFYPDKSPTMEQLRASMTGLGTIGVQVRVLGRYTADFLILHKSGLKGDRGIVVECDGHAFHERTKEQAAHDKARDREMQEAGFRVFRFTGSEIWEDPFSCANSVLFLAHDEALFSAYAREEWKLGNHEQAALWIDDPWMAMQMEVPLGVGHVKA